MSSFKQVTHVIFDMDGLLLDSEILYRQVAEEVAAEYGKTYTTELYIRCMGVTAVTDAQDNIETLGLPLTVEEYLEKVIKGYKKVFPDAELLPDTERLYTEATQALCTPYGKQYTWEIKVQCMGMKGPTAAQHIINSLGLPMTVEEYLKRIADQYNALFPTAKKLADTENRYMEATQAVCSEFDKEYTWEFKYQLMGMKGQLVGQRIIDTLGLPLTLAEYQTKTSRHHKRLFPESKILPDTERLYSASTQAVVGPFGKEYTWEIKCPLMGRVGRELAAAIVKALDVPLTPDEYLVSVEKQYAIYFPQACVMPDNVELYVECHNQVLASYGHTITWDDIMKEMGHTALEVAQTFCSKFGLDLTPEDYRSEVSSHYPRVFPTIKLMKGAEKLVRHLHEHNIPIAIASGGAKDSFDLKTTNHKEFISMFKHVVLASTDPEVKNGKPAPDVFLICAKRFPDNPEPEKCLVFEDAPNGVAASLAAGMQVVMVPDPRMAEDMKKDATLVVKSLEDFQPELFGLPPYPK